MLALKSFLVCVTIVGVSSYGYNMCSMFQWEATQGTIVGSYSNGAPSVVLRNTEVSYDFNNSQIATTTYITQDGQQVEVKNIYNYKQKILYAIRGESCRKIMLNEPFRAACVPRNFSLTWTKTYYGMTYFVENRHLFIFEFQGMINDHRYILQTTMDFKFNPVFEQIIGVSDGVSVFTNSAYHNMTVGIKDPGVFKPPPSCMGVDVQVDPDAIPKRLGLVTF